MDRAERHMRISLKKCLLKVYRENEGKKVCEEEVKIEEILTFVVNHKALEVEMTIGENPTKQKTYKFKNKEQLESFARRFFKAKILAEDNKPLPKCYRHIAKPPWLKEVTKADEKVFANFDKHGGVFKALIPDFGSSPLKYIVLATDEKKFLIMSKKIVLERTILFEDITSMSLKFSSLGSIIVNYVRGGKVKKLKVLVASLKEYLWIRSAFYQSRCPELLLSPSAKQLSKIPTSFFLFTFNINRQPIQSDLSLLFGKSEGCSLAAVCLQEVPLMHRSSTLKQIEGHFNKRGMATVAVSSMWEMAFLVFCRQELKSFITRVRQCELTAGFLNVVGNKGALLISFEFMENRLAFAGVHLKHGQDKIKARNKTLWKMFKLLRFGFDAIEAPLLADHFFLLGDTNYRIDHSFEVLVKELDKNNIDYLLKLDQLSSEKSQGRILYNFQVLCGSHGRRARSRSSRRTSC